MSANVSAVFLVFFLLLRACQQVLTMDPHDVQEKQGSQVKRRLSLQSTGELQQQVHCSLTGPHFVMAHRIQIFPYIPSGARTWAYL